MVTAGECRVLLGQLVENGRVNRELQERLERTQGAIDGVLLEVLLDCPYALLREAVVTVLGERRNWKVVPHLISALCDQDEHVRYELLIAIEKCAGIGIGTLSETLFLDRSKPRQVRSRVAAWWEIVKR